MNKTHAEQQRADKGEGEASRGTVKIRRVDIENCSTSSSLYEWERMGTCKHASRRAMGRLLHYPRYYVRLNGASLTPPPLTSRGGKRENKYSDCARSARSRCKNQTEVQAETR